MCSQDGGSGASGMRGTEGELPPYSVRSLAFRGRVMGVFCYGRGGVHADAIERLHIFRGALFGAKQLRYCCYAS